MIPRPRKMSNLLRQQVVAAIELDEAPRVTRGGSLILDVPGAKYRALVSAGGTVSQAGRHYYDLTGKEPPRNGIDPNATPYRRRKRELVFVKTVLKWP